MTADISYDFVMKDEMSFVEGTYRLPENPWQVFVLGPDSSVSEPVAIKGKWPRGMTGIFIKWPRSAKLNKGFVERTLSQHLGVTHWNEMRGPDSIQLR